MLKRLFRTLGGGTPPAAPVAAGDEDATRDADPARPLAPTANRPRVTVSRTAAVAEVGASPVRPGASRVGPLGPPLASGRSWAILLLSGDRLGDVLVTADGAAAVPEGTLALLDGVATEEAEPAVEVPRDSLVGAAFPGVTGARALVTTPSRSVLRLGPPPAARWAVVGLRSVAVLAGKLTLVDGDDAHDVRPGEAALVADPTATLFVQAGNDAAVAIAFAAPGVVIRLA